MIVTQKMFGYCGRLRAVSLFVNRSAMFVEAVVKSTFGFSYVLFVTVVTFRLQNSRIFCERERRTIFDRKAGASEKTARENGERR